MKVEKLPWDTNHFGYPIGKVTIDKPLELKEELEQASQEYRLLYVFSEQPISIEGLTVGDSKEVFHKQVTSKKNISAVYSANLDYLDRVKEIGRQSGRYSRFNLDPNFDNNEFERLYDIWVERSLKREIAYDVLSVNIQGTIAGVMTLRKENRNSSSIGIIAVGEEFRGLGIGSELIAAAEDRTFDHGHDQLIVATQGKNTAACRFYRNQGFELLSRTYVYHYWNNHY